jgi:hypothetical protein
VDQVGQRLPEPRRPEHARVRLDHILDVARDVGPCTGRGPAPSARVVVEGVPVVDDDPGHPRERERLDVRSAPSEKGMKVGRSSPDGASCWCGVLE